MSKAVFSKLKQKAVVLSVLALGSVAFVGPATTFAANGNWTSTVQRDINGLSETGSVNRTSSATFELGVRTGGEVLVGHKTVTIAKGAQDYHDCWGGLNTDKYGFVKTKSANHDPWFDA